MLRNPWLRWLAIVLLILLLLMLAFHCVEHGVAAEDMAMGCFVIVLVAALIVPPRLILIVRRARPPRRRGPPLRATPVASCSPARLALTVPLRL
jgi:uncharacterized membrane protein YhaH (DUF805 family)